MVRFIHAEELKSRYDVLGHFYSVEFSRNKVVECRSVLEIVDQAHAPDKMSVLSKQKPDAIFIMMNPGSSKPLVEFLSCQWRIGTDHNQRRIDVGYECVRCRRVPGEN